MIFCPLSFQIDWCFVSWVVVALFAAIDVLSGGQYTHFVMRELSLPLFLFLLFLLLMDFNKIAELSISCPVFQKCKDMPDFSIWFNLRFLKWKNIANLRLNQIEKSTISSQFFNIRHEIDNSPILLKWVNKNSELLIWKRHLFINMHNTLWILKSCLRVFGLKIIKDRFKRGEECDTYLTHTFRYLCSVERSRRKQWPGAFSQHCGFHQLQT